MGFLSSADLFACLLVVTFMSLALYKVIDIIAERVMPWKPEQL
jgi:ABC-type nitrate/sulfonate/bicarbonate transport system permease component